MNNKAVIFLIKPLCQLSFYQFLR